ncbi:MAG: hypothetical protein ABI241_00640 [Bacteroidia bacterium]
MNDNTAIFLEKLANKLGTTTEYLWKILLKQAFNDAVISTIYLIVICVIFYIMYLKRSYLMDEDNIGVSTICVIAILFMLIFACFCFESAISGFFNPEYWALNEIINSIK